MNSLEIRNQKLAELRAQKAKGIRRPIIALTNPELPPQDLTKPSELEPTAFPCPEPPVPSEATFQEVESTVPVSFPSVASPDLTSDRPSKKQISDKNQEEIAKLQQLIQDKKNHISSLGQTIKNFQSEKQKIQAEIKEMASQQAIIRLNYNEKVKSIQRIKLESCINEMIRKIYSNRPEDQTENLESIYGSYHDLKKNIENMKNLLIEKENQAKYLRENLENIMRENVMMSEALISQIPEPPIEENYQSVEAKPSSEGYSKNLISDVGSTGNLQKHLEESKNSHYPCPDDNKIN